MTQNESPAASSLPWSIVWALSVTQIISWGSIYYAISVLLPYIESDLGWSRDAIIGAYSLGLLCAAFGAFPVGAWIDRHGGRSIMTAGSIAAALLFALMSQTSSLIVFYALWAGLGLAMAMLLYEPAFAVINQNFRGSARKGITALALSGGFASTVFWPFTQFLISATGWRNTLIALALCNLALCAPLHAFFLPASAGRSHATDAIGAAIANRAAPPELRKILAGRTFWLLAIAFSANMLAFSALSVHFIPLLHEKGFTMADAVWIATLIGPMQVVGRIGELTVGARFRPTQVALFAFALLPLALMFLSYGGPPWLVILGFVVPYGMGNGIMTIVRGMIPIELFGPERYGAVNGALATPVAAARAVGPFVAAVIWSAFGGYTVVLWTLAAIGILSAGAFGVALAGRRES